MTDIKCKHKPTQISIFDHGNIQKTIVKSKKKEVRYNRWKINDDTKKKLIEYYDSVNKFPTKNELKKLADEFETHTKNIRIFFQNKRQRSKIKEQDMINFEDKLIIDDEYIESIYDYHETNIILDQFEKEDKEMELKYLNLEYNKLNNINFFLEYIDYLYKIKFDYIANLNMDEQLTYRYIIYLNLEYVSNLSIIDKITDEYISNILDIIIK